MIKVKAVQDDNSHWYLVPNEKVDEFYELLDLANKEDDYEEFDDQFAEYMTGGDINNEQLYIEV